VTGPVVQAMILTASRRSREVFEDNAVLLLVRIMTCVARRITRTVCAALCRLLPRFRLIAFPPVAWWARNLLF